MIDKPEPPAPLADRLREQIKHHGPISFHDWMQAALYDPEAGYYCVDRERQGRRGDYRTAPETSPLFAATFATYFSKLFTDLKWPPSLTIFEAGCGTGHFAYGVLDSLRREAPGIFAVTNYVIAEISPAARGGAAERLSEFAGHVTFRRFDEIEKPVTAGIVFSNELIDAFPIHRVTMRAGALHELYVGIDGEQFVWVEGELQKAVADYCRGLKMREGQIAEINLTAGEFIETCSGLFERGYVITVDYGAEREELLTAPHRFAGTLRAFRRHQLIDDALANPGEQDLTTTIDWTQVMEAGSRAGLRTIRFDQLDRFLLNEGYGLLAHVAMSADAAESARLLTSARELVLPTGLAASFQVCVQEK